MRRTALPWLLALIAATSAFAQADQAGYLYTYAINESRYGDFVYSIDAYKPVGSPNARIRPFVDVFGNDDSKSAGGSVPRIYSDNYAGGAFGLQYTTPAGLRIFAQAGATHSIGPIASVPSGGDVRGGVELYREWGGPNNHKRTYGNFYGSGTYYSRYQDAVFYNQLETGRTSGSATRPIDTYVRGVLTADSHSFYYDNIAEITAGVRFHPFGLKGPSIALEEAAGIYTRAALLPIGTNRSYFDFRPTISYGVNI